MYINEKCCVKSFYLQILVVEKKSDKSSMCLKLCKLKFLKKSALGFLHLSKDENILILYCSFGLPIEK